jgi:DNA repair protein RadC
MIPQSASPCFSFGEISVAYQPRQPTAERTRITCSRDAYAILTAHWNGPIEWRESFYILLLNRANEALAVFRVSEGGVSGTVADPKIIFQVALGVNASGIILAHNHPSGNLMPSQPDRDLTRKLKDGAKLLDMTIQDHLILSTRTFLSFADEGML